MKIRREYPEHSKVSRNPRVEVFRILNGRQWQPPSFTAPLRFRESMQHFFVHHCARHADVKCVDLCPRILMLFDPLKGMMITLIKSKDFKNKGV